VWLFPVFFAFQLVDLNQASLEQLRTVDGVGQKMAERMIDHRNEKGGFASIEDLMLITGMKPKLFEKVKKYVTIGRVPKSIKSAQAPSLISDQEVEDLLQNFEGEPSVRAVQEEALKYANAHPEQIRSWLSRARKSYWLPKLATGVSPHLGHVDTAREKVGDPDILTSREARDWRFNIKAEWHLNNLVFNRDEVMLGREFLKQSLMRERILNRINEAYFERRRLQIQKRTGAFQNSPEKIEAALKLQELTAELDGLTGGWFSK
jgi:competence ComEA-like helix-hairpin-helix protein